ncbi:MAG TPA: SDR family oxidoreductase [Capillimicrobium sp.]|jgi:NAD(P)-dependent dehydrogenase (short-subunit alcohol dehydrogenase family)
MQIDGTTALVTGANRGLGRAYAQALLDAGAAKVYAGVRSPTSFASDDARLVGVALDVTDDAQIAAAAAGLPDVELVISNAGVAVPGPALEATREDALRQLDVNALGPLAVGAAFAPVLAANGGGAIVNVLSVGSWITVPGLATYAASKAAAWSLTNALRLAVREQGTQVVGVHVGFLDTDMTAALDVEKIAPAVVAQATLAGLEAGETEVLVDELSRNVKAALPDDHAALYGVGAAA